MYAAKEQERKGLELSATFRRARQANRRTGLTELATLGEEHADKTDKERSARTDPEERLVTVGSTARRQCDCPKVSRPHQNRFFPQRLNHTLTIEQRRKYVAERVALLKRTTEQTASFYRDVPECYATERVRCVLA